MQLSTGFSFIIPYFDMKDEVVWGATAMILFELREILKSEP
ncbi:MAG: hypothetical protein NT150_08830 [Bacteroidetes bacterium]|nr:hypothetical protein [Bacteroidota bacterium]